MRSPEILPSYPEFRPELAPEQNLCLKSLLTQVEVRIRDGNDHEADDRLIDGLNQAVVEGGEDSGEFGMACQRQGCEASCVMLVRSSDVEDSIAIENPESLKICVEEL